MTKQNALNLPFASNPPIWTPLILLNGWQDYGAPYPPPAYSVWLKQVFLRGVLKSGASGIFAQIPSSLAPSSVLYFNVLAADIYAYISCDSGANLAVYTTNSGYVFLNQVIYLIL